jgi:hypothetical protein
MCLFVNYSIAVDLLFKKKGQMKDYHQSDRHLYETILYYLYGFGDDLLTLFENICL